MGKLNTARVGRVLEKMEAQGMGQLIVTSPVSISYLTGEMIHPGERALALYLNTDGNAVLLLNALFLHVEVAGTERIVYQDTEDPIALLASHIKPGKLGVDKEWTAQFLLHLMELRTDLVVSNGSYFVDVTRMVKDAEEQELLRRASLINDKVVGQAIDAIDMGLSEWQLAQRVAEFFEAAAPGSNGEFSIVSYGANAAMPHHGPARDAFLKSGENVLFDIGRQIDGYYCDMTRTVAYQHADELQREIYNIVLEANLAGIAAVRPGVRCCDVDAASRQVIEKAGYGKYFTHRTGHNIGIEDHEWPDISSTSEVVLVPGMSFSVEPGIYLPNSVGVRVEDLVIVTETGCEVLNHYPKEFRIVG